jgi:hypothetical protein
MSGRGGDLGAIGRAPLIGLAIGGRTRGDRGAIGRRSGSDRTRPPAGPRSAARIGAAIGYRGPDRRAIGGARISGGERAATGRPRSSGRRSGAGGGRRRAAIGAAIGGGRATGGKAITPGLRQIYQSPGNRSGARSRQSSADGSINRLARPESPSASHHVRPTIIWTIFSIRVSPPKSAFRYPR